MKSRSVRFTSVVLTFVFPEECDDRMAFLLDALPPADPELADSTIEIHNDSGSSQFSLVSAGLAAPVPLTDELFVEQVAQTAIRLFASHLLQGPAFMAAAVQLEHGCIVIPGRADPGKWQLAAWLCAQGYTHLSTDLVVLDHGSGTLRGLAFPFLVDPAQAREVAPLLKPLAKYYTRCGNNHLFQLQDTVRDEAREERIPSLLLFPKFVPGTPLKVSPLSPAQASMGLMGCLLNAQQLGATGFSRTARLAKEIPALTVSFGSADDLDLLDSHFLTTVVDHKLSPAALTSLLQPIRPASSEETTPAGTMAPVTMHPLPEPHPTCPRKRLTIGMATYDDYDGVYFSVMALCLYHSEVIDDAEILVLDNHPDGPCGEPLRQLARSVPNLRYVPLSAHAGTMVRDYLFRYAAGDLVLCIDGHVLIQQGALKRLLDYWALHPDSRDLLQGPLVYDDLATVQTHFEPNWRSGMFGTWACDSRGEAPDNPPFEIPMQGLGLFACARKAWPGFNPRFRGFGGEEGYIHEKVRQNGGNVLCLPFLRWVHRFARPMGVPYPLIWQDRIFNYLVGCKELGLDDTRVREHFAGLLGADSTAREYQAIDAELNSPFFFFDVICCLTSDQESRSFRSLTGQLTTFGIMHRVRFFRSSDRQDEQVDRALSHRRIILMAKQLGVGNILVLEEGRLFRDDAAQRLHDNLSMIQDKPWQIFFFDEEPQRTMCGVVYHESVFDRILQDLPGTEEALRHWIVDNTSVSQFLRSLPNVYFADPAIVEATIS
ncbi:glycosyltransferase family 2 protein [Desulfofustis glycolicus]|uniref:Glycosyl transferase family 2 n=1 Tax=Desulfofustis glycolicus DSM 9705 TaxID=1121409 RepID=A0A1M5TNK2_9BACT|nr:glycosyltransferase [Desulfofustis glycolicus]MCB2216508.1 glycosyltransferase [Desulfobulbaceae bacterium]SHH52268.1 Glycosyl transferase family 2 [Desulfofustis glycolicus DSM 9705]